MREKYETLSLATLKELAKGRGMRGISTLKKGELIEAMLLQDEKDAANKDIAATPSVTRREKATVVRGRRPSASEQEKAKADAGTVPEAGKAETGAAATDEWQSVRGDTQHPDIRQPYLEQSGKTDECDTTSGKCTGAWQKKRHAAGTDVCGAYTAECR